MSSKKKLVLVGNGMAGMKAIEEIIAIDKDMFDITVFGAEKYPNYNRILLSTVLAGDAKVDDIILNSEDWYKENNITLHLGKEITEIHRGRKTVTTEDGLTVPFDNVILATGSNPFIIPIPGVKREGVITFRDIKDCEKMMHASKVFKKATVIGGGLLGLEAAKGLINLGMEVTVVHDQSHLMNMQLDQVAGEMLKKSLEDQGMKFLLKKLTSEITGVGGDGHVTGLKFTDNSSIETDLVVMSVGIRPNIELAKKSLLYTNRGVIVNDYLETLTDPSVYALGECVEHRNSCYGLVAPLFEQARILANHITGVASKSYEGSVVSTKLKVSGVNVFSAGDFLGENSDDVIEYRDKNLGIYKKVNLKDNKIIGTVLFGDTELGPTLFQKMLDENIISDDDRPSLLFGSSFGLGDAGHSGLSQIENMADDAVVCGCNGITKGAVVDAIKTKGLTTREEVTGCTKAAGSCGGCAPLVDSILATVLGTSFETSNKKKPICKCTNLTHEEVKEEIKENELLEVMDAMKFLNWKGEGCHVCRPALNYYIQMIFPNDTTDDSLSRVANERNHGNIQKDCTYSVIPRIYGGLTNGDDLIKLGKVAKKYNINDVKITGGQRIGLFGVKKEDLTNVWKDLDMNAGFAYGKALRTAKTCVGSKWCRFGTQDSMSVGIELEKIFGRMWTPAKFKIGVSGCPRNCAEATIKDLGVVGVEGGYELYVAGNAGVKVRPSDLLALVKTEDELIELSKAYVQYYREDARHNERTAVWVERVGLEAIKAQVVDNIEKRNELVSTIDAHLETLTKDPWKEIIDKEEQVKDEVEKSFLLPLQVGGSN